jgi:hypothetical protein
MMIALGGHLLAEANLLKVGIGSAEIMHALFT